MTGDLDPEPRWWNTASNGQLRLAAWLIVFGMVFQTAFLVFRVTLGILSISRGTSAAPAPLFAPLLLTAIYLFTLLTLLGLLNGRLGVRGANGAIWALLVICPIRFCLPGPGLIWGGPLSGAGFGPPWEWGPLTLAGIAWWLALLALCRILLRSGAHFYSLLKPICCTPLAALLWPVVALVAVAMASTACALGLFALIPGALATYGLVLAPKILLAIAFFRAAREDEAFRMQGLEPAPQDDDPPLPESSKGPPHRRRRPAQDETLAHGHERPLRLAGWLLILGALFAAGELFLTRFLVRHWTPSTSQPTFPPVSLFSPLFLFATYAFALFTLMGLLSDRLRFRGANKILWAMVALGFLQCLHLALFPMWPLARTGFVLFAISHATLSLAYILLAVALAVALLRNLQDLYGLLKPICWVLMLLAALEILRWAQGFLTIRVTGTILRHCLGAAFDLLLALAFFRAAREDERLRVQGLEPEPQDGDPPLPES